VFADNMIEHVSLARGRAFLQHAHRAMRPGGTLRLTTPDVAAAVRLYLGEDEAGATAVLGMYRDEGRVSEHAVDLLRVPFAEHGHHVGYLYDEASLSAELKRAGFHAIRRCATGESVNPELRDLENRTNAESFIQLILEADA
jgi:predicted SAM-dependent methyltransferase